MIDSVHINIYIRIASRSGGAKERSHDVVERIYLGGFHCVRPRPGISVIETDRPAAWERKCTPLAPTDGVLIGGGVSGFPRGFVVDYVSALHAEFEDLCVDIGKPVGNELIHLNWRGVLRNSGLEKGVLFYDISEITGGASTSILVHQRLRTLARRADRILAQGEQSRHGDAIL